MTRTLKVAAVQMDATPAPLTDRLGRAADLIAEAAGAGAQLVALPELFNTGYTYADSNYAAAEPTDGPTIRWMRAQAAQHNVHVVGSLLLREPRDIFNTALLIAPDGRTWRYDKTYPWLWERAYFREAPGTTIAETDLGKFGMLICWDSAHPELWDAYAGQVDAMLIVSCPPRMSHLTLTFPDGSTASSTDVPGLDTGEPPARELFPDIDTDTRAAWMRVPVVATAGAGTFRAKLPLPQVSVLPYVIGRPNAGDRVAAAAEAIAETGYDPQTKIVGADGAVIARVTDGGDGFVIAEVPLAVQPPQPNGPQPKMHTPDLIYFYSDVFAPSLLANVYRRAVRQRFGAQMAPYSARTQARIRAVRMAAAVLVGVLVGARLIRWLRRR
ncbi:MAG: carbon-nitrogen hydrolase family protein [Chloroflexi bacterium]|nr:carbon-nitrogen hydrolase family protein [Chloroflexota bacterium]